MTETTDTEKRYLHIDRTIWYTILTGLEQLAGGATNKPTLAIGNAIYEFSQPHRNSNFITITKQPWLDYDMMESGFAIIPHTKLTGGEDSIKGFIVPASWITSDIWTD